MVNRIRTKKAYPDPHSTLEIPLGMEHDFPFFLDFDLSRESASQEAEKAGIDMTVIDFLSMVQNSSIRYLYPTRSIDVKSTPCI